MPKTRMEARIDKLEAVVKEISGMKNQLSELTLAISSIAQRLQRLETTMNSQYPTPTHLVESSTARSGMVTNNKTDTNLKFMEAGTAWPDMSGSNVFVKEADPEGGQGVEERSLEREYHHRKLELPASEGEGDTFLLVADSGAGIEAHDEEIAKSLLFMAETGKGVDLLAGERAELGAFRAENDERWELTAAFLEKRLNNKKGAELEKGKIFIRVCDRVWATDYVNWNLGHTWVVFDPGILSGLGGQWALVDNSSFLLNHYKWAFSLAKTDIYSDLRVPVQLLSSICPKDLVDFSSNFTETKGTNIIKIYPEIVGRLHSGVSITIVQHNWLEEGVAEALENSGFLLLDFYKCALRKGKRDLEENCMGHGANSFWSNEGSVENDPKFMQARVIIAFVWNILLGEEAANLGEEDKGILVAGGTKEGARVLALEYNKHIALEGVCFILVANPLQEYYPSTPNSVFTDTAAKHSADQDEAGFYALTVRETFYDCRDGAGALGASKQRILVENMRAGWHPP